MFRMMTLTRCPAQSVCYAQEWVLLFDLRSSPPCKAKFKQVRLCSCFVRRFIELSLREALEEVAAGVFENSRLNDEHARD